MHMCCCHTLAAGCVNDWSVLQLVEASAKGIYTAGPFTPGTYFYACSLGQEPFRHCIGRNGTNVMRLRVDVAAKNGTAVDHAHDGSRTAEPAQPGGTAAASSNVQRSVTAVAAAAVAAVLLLL
jgi:hypothetical protein